MTKKRTVMYKNLILCIVGVFLFGCTEINTTDAAQVYKYWSGADAPSDIKLFNGQYWQSSHFTKEYIMYLKCRPTKNWWDTFIKQNGLISNNTKWIRPDDAPPWFQPANSSSRFTTKDNFQGSSFFRDSVSGICYLYEIQL